MATASYTKLGTKTATPVKLDKTIFDVEVPNHELLHQAYVSYLANGRKNLAVVKTRGKVSGGGRKPWRQKGTGRARFGSSRNPIWRGGGITFGPTGLENYTKKLPANQKKHALKQALSLASKSNKIIVIESIEVKTAKTAALVKLLAKIGTRNQTLLIVENKSDALIRASQNVPTIKVVQATYSSVFDILNADTIIITKEALHSLGTWLGKEAS